MPPSRSGSAADIAEIVRLQIDGGEYAPGAKLPTARELAAVYRVTPNTAAKALRILAGEGLVEIRYGSGTYVRSPRPRQPLGPAAYARSRWGTPVGLAPAVVPCDSVDELVATALGVGDGETVSVRRRLIGDGDGPTHLVTSFYPPGVEVEPRMWSGLHDDGFALPKGAHEVVETLRGRQATADEASMLNLPAAGEPVVEVRRVTRDADGRPVEYGVGVYPASRFEWSFRFTIPD